MTNVMVTVELLAAAPRGAWRMGEEDLEDVVRATKHLGWAVELDGAPGGDLVKLQRVGHAIQGVIRTRPELAAKLRAAQPKVYLDAGRSIVRVMFSSVVSREGAWGDDRQAHTALDPQAADRATGALTHAFLAVVEAIIQRKKLGDRADPEVRRRAVALAKVERPDLVPSETQVDLLVRCPAPNPIGMSQTAMSEHGRALHAEAARTDTIERRVQERARATNADLSDFSTKLRLYNEVTKALAAGNPGEVPFDALGPDDRGLLRELGDDRALFAAVKRVAARTGLKPLHRFDEVLRLAFREAPATRPTVATAKTAAIALFLLREERGASVHFAEDVGDTFRELRARRPDLV